MSVQHKKTVMMIVVVILAILVEVLCHAPCGCAPQPTIIQLSCDGRGSGSVAPQQPPPAAPAPAPAVPAPATDFNMNQTSSHDEATTAHIPGDGFDDSWCSRDWEGRPKGNPPGGFPEGFRWTEQCAGSCRCEHPSIWVGHNNNNQRMPPINWYGDLADLDFDIGQPGTPTYNMVMCWPMRIADNSPEGDCVQYGSWINFHVNPWAMKP